MTKQIKIKDETYDKLGRYGKFQDTFDAIIQRLLEGVESRPK